MITIEVTIACMGKRPTASAVALPGRLLSVCSGWLVGRLVRIAILKRLCPEIVYTPKWLFLLVYPHIYPVFLEGMNIHKWQLKQGLQGIKPPLVLIHSEVPMSPGSARNMSPHGSHDP